MTYVAPNRCARRRIGAAIWPTGVSAAGWVQDATDPRGIDARTYYDALGRTTETVSNYTGNAETAESDVAVEYTYDGANHVTTVQADEPAGAY
jgi:YD repeat-containing protein